jgi:hypothetical protein
LDELHRLAVHRRPPERCPVGQDRHQGPFVFEGFEQNRDVDRGRDPILIVADIDDHIGLTDGERRRRGAELLIELVQHRRVLGQRHPHLARLADRAFLCQRHRCQQQRKGYD